jgi:hypothetical protein
MLLVPITPYGETRWTDKLEAESVDAFVEQQNAKVVAHFPKGQYRTLYTKVSPTCVEYRLPNGKLVETYRVFEETPSGSQLR